MQKVLLVNDCKFESMVMKDILSSLNYNVIISNEYSAMGDVRELSPDIVVCNLIMKHTTGNLLIEKIKTLNPEVKCYLSSSSKIRLEDYRKNKVDGVIHTPAKKEDIKNLLDEEKEVNSILLKKEKLSTKKIIKGLKIKTTNLNAHKLESKPEQVDKRKRIIFCPYCGEKLEPNKATSRYLFCPYCGSKL